jgi:hypothetical protein
MSTGTFQEAQDEVNDGQARFRWSRIFGFRPWRKRRAQRTPPPNLNMNPTCAESPELMAFLAEAESLGKRLELRNPWTRAEITVLLQGAINAARTTYRADGVDNIATAWATLQRAEAVYYHDVQTKNRIVYVVGLGLGVCAVVLIPLLLLWAVEVMGAWFAASTGSIATPIRGTFQWIATAAPLAITAPLFFFAGLGASASVLSRLTTIDLKEETSKAMVLIAAAARPALAVIFASVIFVILNNNIVSIGTDTTKLAMIWVAAFLCGYSERFASDILDRVPFAPGGNGAPASPAGNVITRSGPDAPHPRNGGSDQTGRDQ